MILFGISTVAILTIAVAVLTVERGPRGLGIRFFVAIAALLLLGAADSRLDWMLRRRDLFSVGDSPWFRRYRYISLSLLVLAGIGLLGLAWFLAPVGA